MKGNHTAAKITPETLATNLNPSELPNDSWQMLQIFSVYRCLLTSAFFMLIILNAGTVGQQHPLVYVYVLLVYFLLSIVYLFNAFLKNQAYLAQVNLQLITDIVALTLIMHTSGGIPSGFNILFLPIVAAASVLMPGKLSYFYASLATIAILLEQLYAYFMMSFKHNNTFTLAGLTGIAIFATAIAINIIYKRLNISQQISKEYRATLLRFQQVLLLIMQKMPLGVVVADAANKISVINQTAQKLLGYNTETPISFDLAEDMPVLLQDKLREWRSESTTAIQDQNYSFIHNGTNIALQFIAVGDDKQSFVIIMLENLSQQEQQAQNLKLISLGRITASIAHEIRNPLNAISHSSQLLNESKNLDKEDTHLLSIIRSNSERTNRIIESVLLLSKAKPIVQQQLHLQTWMNKFINQFVAHGHPDSKIEFICDVADNNVRFDPTHLQQILTNLCENGIRYSERHINRAGVLLEVGQDNMGLYLDVIDSGPGVAEENLKFLFEPFFTTENTGTGLGLYVAKELARANGAKLEYYKTNDMGGCFRIYFPSKH